ncbi:PEP-CTERM sorting domain-containing protein [Zoogloea sp.]|uniref:PEP-CTERM sorting domain-containing protein n=1 Tax=Zoogloea sp. TaxID=49181 RepID=UPI0035B076DE
MIKKQLAIAIGAALTFGGVNAANAGVYTSTADFSGNFVISGFSDATPDSFQIKLTNVKGLLDLNVPNRGVISAERKGDVALDVSPKVPGAELVSHVPNWITLGTGEITSTGLTGSHFVYDFNTNTFTSNGAAVTGGAFTGGASSLNLLLGNIFGPLGGAIGDGSVSVQHTLGNGTWTIDVTETDKNGSGFSGLFYALDNGLVPAPLSQLLGNKDGKIDGLFAVNGAVRLTVPEPASMALVGFGLAGMAALRRRKAA